MKLKSHRCYYASDLHTWLLTQNLTDEESNLFFEAISYGYAHDSVLLYLNESEEFNSKEETAIVCRVKTLLLETNFKKTILIELSL